MLPSDRMPEDNADLARTVVSFPYLPQNLAETCPVLMDEILDYLALEAPDGDVLEAEDLQFLRTARVVEYDYWIWRFTESDGSEAYVAVSRRSDGQTCVVYDTNYYGLSAEQFMLGNYHGVF
jgi:hypothetical protein